MGFALDDVIVDNIESAVAYSNDANNELLYSLGQQLNDAPIKSEYECPVDREKIEAAVKILNRKQEIFNVDKLAYVLAKCEIENLIFSEIWADESWHWDCTRTFTRRVFINKKARIYYPFVHNDVTCPYERDGDYLIIIDNEMINVIASLNNKNDESLLNNSEDELKRVPEDEFDSSQELFDVNSVKCFISKIGVSIARLKSEAEHSSYTEFFEQLQNIIDLERIMNDAIKLLKE